MGVRGDFSTVNRFKASLKALPLSVAHDVAGRAAPAMTKRTLASFASQQTVYGGPRPAGADGRALTLHKTGAAEREMKFVAYGTIVRCKIDVVDKYGSQYGRYLIGKYAILPMGSLPALWSADLREMVASAQVPK